MNPAFLSRFIFHILYLVGVIQLFYYFTILPNEVAFWVDLKGNTYLWMSKQTLLVFQFAVMTLIVILINLFATLVKKKPSIMLIPKKNFWLSIDRKEESIIEFSRYLNLFGGLILFFLIFYFNSILEMNVQNNFGNVSLLKIIIVVFPLILLFIIILFIRKFNKI